MISCQLYSQNLESTGKNGFQFFVGDAITQFPDSRHAKFHNLLSGVGFEYFVYDNFSVEVDLISTKHQASYKSKIIVIPGFMGNGIDDWGLYNIKTSHSVIEFPLYLNYQFKIYKSFYLRLIGGYSVSFISEEKTNYTKIKSLSNDENGYRNHDFIWDVDPGFNELYTIKNLVLGMGYDYKNFFVRTLIVKNINKGYFLNYLLNFTTKLDIIDIYFGIKF